MDTISAYEACESYGYRYAILLKSNPSGERSVYGLYGSKRAAKRIAFVIGKEYGKSAEITVAKIVQ